jgi:ribonuclease HI
VNYLVYTDGSASVKDRTGGYAWKVIVAGGQFIGGGSELDTTISRMELMAAIGALEFIIWDRLEKAAGCFDLVHFEHVKGHAGHVDNEAVDVLAGEFRQAAVESLK